MIADLRAPFPWFGAKRLIAGEIWSRLGDTPNYVEPFAGSLAVLLARPDAHEWWDRTETVNDADGLLCNFWRAVQHDPEAVARYADWPVMENDLHARHAWLVERRASLTARLEGDPCYYDARAAGWWVWGLCAWIGGGWASGKGPWRAEDGVLVRREGEGINRSRPHLRNAGQGINRKRPRMEDGSGHAAAWSDHVAATMRRLSDRLRRVRVCSGDWLRVCGPAPTVAQGVTGVVLDPPYAHAERDAALYAHEDDISAAVRAWALAHGDDPRLRIALCGYDTEHAMPPSWTAVSWQTHGGYALLGNGRGRANRNRETVWFSPHCLQPGRPVQVALPLEVPS